MIRLNSRDEAKSFDRFLVLEISIDADDIMTRKNFTVMFSAVFSLWEDSKLLVVIELDSELRQISTKIAS